MAAISVLYSLYISTELQLKKLPFRWQPILKNCRVEIMRRLISLLFLTLFFLSSATAQSKSDGDQDSLPQLNVFIPNAFTPNADGTNDFWIPVIQGREIQSYELYIINRHGQEVFRTEDPRRAWNGAVKGEPYVTTPTIYMYFLKLNVEGDLENRVYKGHITVVR